VTTVAGLLRVWPAYKRLTELSFPRRFPIAQFPNLPLIVAILDGEVGKFLDGSAHSYAESVSYLTARPVPRSTVPTPTSSSGPG
jgi:hypothetical protein